MALSDLDVNTPYEVRYSPVQMYDGTFSQQPTFQRFGSNVLNPNLPVAANGNYPWNAWAAQPINAKPTPRFNLAGLFGSGAPTNIPAAYLGASQYRGPNNNTAGGVGGMVSTTKSPAVQGGINTAITTRTGNAAAEAQSLKDYAAQVLSGQPKAQAFADQETGAINQIYGSGGDSLQAQLAALNRQEQAANNIAAQRAASGVRRGINAQRAGGGSSSYLDRLLAQQLYGIGAQNAGRGYQQGRNDLTWLTGQRTGQVGRRASILDTLAQRGLAPIQANQQFESGALGNLNRLADLDYGNNVYEQPEDAWRRRLDFMDYASPYYQ